MGFFSPKLCPLRGIGSSVKLSKSLGKIIGYFYQSLVSANCIVLANCVVKGFLQILMSVSQVSESQIMQWITGCRVFFDGYPLTLFYLLKYYFFNFTGIPITLFYQNLSAELPSQAAKVIPREAKARVGGLHRYIATWTFRMKMSLQLVAYFWKNCCYLCA